LLPSISVMVATNGPKMTATVVHSIVMVRCSAQHAILLDLSHGRKVVLECRIGHRFFLPDGLAVDMRALERVTIVQDLHPAASVH
jgi:hypothetical protein